MVIVAILSIIVLGILTVAYIIGALIIGFAIEDGALTMDDPEIMEKGRKDKKK